MRNTRGNMLVLVSIMMSLVGILILLACSFGAVFFESGRLQVSADEVALAGARALNQNDRLGQINNMLARSRQLVYSSRDNYAQVDTSYEHLRNLSQMLLDEARDGAVALEQERQTIHSVAIAEANAAMIAKFNQIKGTYFLSLPWIRVSTPQLISTGLGKLDGIESPVAELNGYDALKNQDELHGYVHHHASAALYHEHSNAKLPGSDGDLNFKLSSLAAPVGDGGTNSNVQVSPARAVLPNKFISADADELPSVCQVKLNLSVATGLGAAGGGVCKSIGTACATGGSMQM